MILRVGEILVGLSFSCYLLGSVFDDVGGRVEGFLIAVFDVASFTSF